MQQSTRPVAQWYDLIIPETPRRTRLSWLALWELPGKRHIWGLSGIQSVAFEVEVNPLEKVLPVEQAIAASFQHLELVVETYHKTAVFALYKIVGDLFPPVFQGVQKVIEVLQSTALDLFDPTADLLLGLRFV